MAPDSESIREALAERIDAGGCTEAWSAAQTYRTEQVDDGELKASSSARTGGSTQGPDETRRRLLKSTGAVTTSFAATGIGAGNALAAEPDETDQADAMLDRDAVADIVEREAAGLLDALAERGYIAERRPAALDFDAVQVGGRITRDTIRVTSETHPEKGEHVLLSTRLPAPEFDRDLVVSIAPDVGGLGASTVKDGEAHVLRPDTDGFVPLSSTSPDCWCAFDSACDCNCSKGSSLAKWVCDGEVIYRCWRDLAKYQCDPLDCSCGGWCVRNTAIRS